MGQEARAAKLRTAAFNAAKEEGRKLIDHDSALIFATAVRTMKALPLTSRARIAWMILRGDKSIRSIFAIPHRAGIKQ